MTFESPLRLWLLLGVVGLLALYVFLQRRRSKYAVRFTSLHLLERVAPTRPAWRRHVPAGLFLVMLAVLVTGFARPSDEVQVPKERTTVVIAVDVSHSMRADDVAPDRLAAAREAATGFIQDLPEHFNIGLVAFAGQAVTLVPPTTDRAVLQAQIETLATGSIAQQGTAIGEAIATAMMAVRSLDAQAAENPPPARVVLLSDGANTAGRSPADAATEAAGADLPVDTISFGTLSGQVVQGGEVIPVPVDGQTLQDVATRTDGTYHEAATADELDAVYKDIGSSVGFRTERQDISARFIGIGLLLAFAAAAASMAWFSRLP